MKKFISFVAILITMISARVSAADIVGRVTDIDNNPMPNATVWIESICCTTISGQDGTYTLRNVPAGTYEVEASIAGYRKETANVTVEGDEVTCNFLMDEACQVMRELFVTPNGESIEDYLLRMVAEHKKTLRERVASYSAKGTFYLEVDNDSTISSLPTPIYRGIKLALSLFKLGKLFQIQHDYPGAKFMVDQQLTFNGKIRGAEPVLSLMNPTVKNDEAEYMRKHHWGIDNTIYDDMYKSFTTRNLAKRSERDAKAFEKEKKAAEKKGETFSGEMKTMRYVGKYEEDGHEVYVLRKSDVEIHIVDGIWQIKRLTKGEKGNYSAMIECREVLPGVYLPVSSYNNVKHDIDSDGAFKKDLEKMKNTDRSKMSSKEQRKLDDDIAKTERILKHRYWEMKNRFSWDYKNLVPAGK